MKTSKLTLSLIAVAVSAGIAITSCKKKENTPADQDSAGAEDNALAQKTSDDASNIGGQASESGGLSSYRYGDENSLTNCATVSVDTTLKTITVTFNGGVCMDGKTRSGTITYDYSQSTNGAKHYRNPGFKVIVTSSNYVVDGNQVSINHTEQNTTAVGFNPMNTNLTWSISANVSITKASGGTITWSKNGTRTLLNTSDTVNVYHGQAIPISWGKARVGLTGSETGKAANGDNFSVNVTSQLVRDMTCSPNSAYPGHHPFIDGSVDFTPGSKATRHINFAYPNSVGSGVCDDQALVTIGSYTKVITLK